MDKQKLQNKLKMAKPLNNKTIKIWIKKKVKLKSKKIIHLIIFKDILED